MTEGKNLNQVKIISRFDGTYELLNGLMIDENHAIFSETNSSELSCIYFVEVVATKTTNVFEPNSPMVTLAEGVNIQDQLKTLQDVKEMILGMSFYTYITKVHFHGRDESLDLIETGGTKVKEWQYEN